MRPKKVILLVDSDALELSLRKFFLETRGFRVIAAESSADAIRDLEETEPGAIDLLLTDLEMSEFNGNELVKLGQILHPEMKSVMTSRISHVFRPDTCADVFLHRAVNTPAELYERIRTLLARKRGPKPLPGVLQGASCGSRKAVAA